MPKRTAVNKRFCKFAKSLIRVSRAIAVRKAKGDFFIKKSPFPANFFSQNSNEFVYQFDELAGVFGLDTDGKERFGIEQHAQSAELSLVALGE